MKKSLLLFIILFLAPFILQAQEQATATEALVLSGKLEVVPSIIDEKAKARDILRYDIVLKNGTARQISVYAMVNDISMTEGQQEFIEPGLLDRKTSLASWITFSRGVKDIPAGGVISIPLEIKVDLTATPGQRYAQIAFPSGSSRIEAQAKTNGGETPKLLVNISVEEEIVERAQIKNFSTAKNVYVKFPIDFSIGLENFGNRQIAPDGSIIIFNRRGEEVASLDINGTSERIEPGVMKEIASEWKDGRGFGKFKAKLEIEYGSKDKRDLQDTVYFWVLPLPMLIMFFAVTIILITIITILLFKRTYHHLPHMPQFQHQGKSIENGGVINLREK